MQSSENAQQWVETIIHLFISIATLLYFRRALRPLNIRADPAALASKNYADPLEWPAGERNYDVSIRIHNNKVEYNPTKLSEVDILFPIFPDSHRSFSCPSYTAHTFPVIEKNRR